MVQKRETNGALGAFRQGGADAEEGLTERALRRISEQKQKRRRAESEVIPVDPRKKKIAERDAAPIVLSPHKDSDRGRFDIAELKRRRIVHADSKDRSSLNVFRYVRRKVIDKLDGRKDGIVLVASVVGGGGGSFTSINLAAVLAAEQGVRSTIVECNPENSSLCQTLDVEAKAGWLDYNDNSSVQANEIIYPTGIADVDLIPAAGEGRSGVDPVSLGSMAAIIDGLRARPNHFIVLHGPSLDSGGDPRIYSELCDCIILVVPYGRVTPDKFKLSLRGIYSEKVAGVLINKSPVVN